MANHADKEVWIEGERWYEIYTPWWTRFGREGNDGLTYLERRYIAKRYMKRMQKVRRNGR